MSTIIVMSTIILISKSTNVGVCEVREKMRTAFLDVILRDEDVRRDCVTS